MGSPVQRPPRGCPRSFQIRFAFSFSAIFLPPGFVVPRVILPPPVIGQQTNPLHFEFRLQAKASGEEWTPGRLATNFTNYTNSVHELIVIRNPRLSASLFRLIREIRGQLFSVTLRLCGRRSFFVTVSYSRRKRMPPCTRRGIPMVSTGVFPTAYVSLKRFSQPKKSSAKRVSGFPNARSTT